MAKCRHPKRYVTETSDQRRCRACCAWLSIGPSNDDIPSGEVIAAVMADSDDYWIGFDDPDGYEWDVSRPLREQWPWGPADPEHMARGDAMLDEAIEKEYAPEIAAIRDSHVETKPRHDWQNGVLAQIGVVGESFSPVDTASREPWRADGETQLSDACSAAVEALDRAETKLRASVDAFAELVTEVPEGAA